MEASVLDTRGTQAVKQSTSLEGAAREFEAMMLTELLKAARKAGEAFGSDTQDNGTKSYLEFADENFARALAAEGALGFSRMIVRQLQPSSTS